jgi:hypothetical protein
MSEDTNTEETTTRSVSDRPNVEGIVVQNVEVQGYIRKHGAPVHSKPHGAEKTVLYYPKAATAADAPEFKDHAGERTPAGRDRIIQKPLMGSTEIGSTIAHRPISGGGAHPQMSPASLGNPNDTLRDADIVNEDALDEEITELEKETIEKRDETRTATLSTGDRVARVSQDPASDPPAPSAEEAKKEAKAENEIPVPGEDPAPGLGSDEDEPFYKDDGTTS